MPRLPGHTPALSRASSPEHVHSFIHSYSPHAPQTCSTRAPMRPMKRVSVLLFATPPTHHREVRNPQDTEVVSAALSARSPFGAAPRQESGACTVAPHGCHVITPLALGLGPLFRPVPGDYFAVDRSGFVSSSSSINPPLTRVLLTSKVSGRRVSLPSACLTDIRGTLGLLSDGQRRPLQTHDDEPELLSNEPHDVDARLSITVR